MSVFGFVVVLFLDLFFCCCVICSDDAIQLLVMFFLRCAVMIPLSKSVNIPVSLLHVIIGCVRVTLIVV